ncbi:MAG: RNA methyltransferase [Victivallales bacterium]|nr:RNA methyltransferase [Victivallales bacterium]
MNPALLKRLRHFSASRHNQRKAPFFVVEGLRCCREALARRPQWLEAAVMAEDVVQTAPGAAFAQAAQAAGVTPEVVSPGEFAALAMTEGPQGMLCVMRKPAAAPPTTLDHTCTLILDQVREPGNVGTILRTAWSVGLSQVWLAGGCAEPWSPKVIRGGMGAQFALTCHSFADLAEAVAHFRLLGGTRVWCAMMRADTTLFSSEFAPCGAALVLGNEGNGIAHPEVGEAVTIPMPGQAESLNVAQAATLLLYEALRRQAKGDAAMPCPGSSESIISL